MLYIYETIEGSHHFALDLFFLLSPAGLDALTEARHALTPVFHVGRDFMLLSQEHTHKLCFLGLKASGVSLASWPTTSSTPLQTKKDSIIHSSQSSKNVNKEQKLPVLYISESLSWNWAFLKLILLQAWPWPLFSTPFSKETVQGRAP